MHGRYARAVKADHTQQQALGQGRNPSHLHILFHKLCAREQGFKLARQRFMRNRFQRRTRNEDVLSAFESRAHFAHIFAHEPPDAVARYGIAYLRRNRKAKALFLPLQVDQNEVLRGVRFSSAIDIAIILIIAKSVFAREAERRALCHTLPLHVCS